jgi:site-specific recombinase XerD
MQSWHPGTKKQYETYLRKLLDFCNQREITYHSPPMRDALGFLMDLHNKGLSYSTIGTARSVLSNVIIAGECENFGSHPLVSRFMKSVFLVNKPIPRYDETWDVALVLRHLETLYPHNEITLKNLSLKLVMITLLTSGQRGQTVHLMSLNDMQMLQDRCRIHIIEHTKTSKPGLSAPLIIVIKQYLANEKICPLISTLRDYLARTNPLRCGENKLFISYQRPYKTVTRQTISRWVKVVMNDAGIDTK